MRLGKIVAAASVFAALGLLIVACGDQPSSPVAPGAAAARQVSAVIPSTEEFCGDEVDNDFDGKTDCADPDCADDPGCTTTPPPPEGKPCSPGFWKTEPHRDQFNMWCDEAAAIPGDVFATCADLFTAISCKGSEPGCTGERRQAAAAALNSVSGCTESEKD